MSIKIDNLTFSYNQIKPVLKNISIHSKCRSIGIVGTSGSGKSTLLRLICGLIKKNNSNILEGSISIDSYDLNTLRELNKIGFMFQEDTLLPYLSVAGNVKLPLKIRNYNNFEIANDYIEKVGLSKDIDKIPSELSGGMKTRVALARTFVTKPDVLLLDEPFTGLDEFWRTTLYKELELLRYEINPFTALVTHHIEEALILCNHIFVLSKNGYIIKDFIIDKPLPRANLKDPINGLRDLQLEIKELILNDSR